ncbi:MAG: aminodeoxychorismate synthase component I [Desulfobulbaceae bacterium]
MPDTIVSALLSHLEASDDFVFLDCARVDSDEHRTFLFTSPHRWLVCSAPSDAGAFLDEADGWRERGYYLAGWIGYEFGYLLEPSLSPQCPTSGPYAVLGVFDSPKVIEHGDADDGPPEWLRALPTGRKNGSFAIANLRPSMTKGEYLRALARIREYIVAGDTYQVNFTLKLHFRCSGSRAGLYEALRRGQAVSYGAWIREGGRDIMSFSPELFFRAGGDRVTVRPMKGTMARGRDLDEDARRSEALRCDLKNRSENVMIVDLLRNDLGRLLHATGGGEVRPRSLFDVETYETVLQMTSTIDGMTSGRSSLSLKEILPALFPCGSVTGAPKIRTMEIIRELETRPRNVYCGAIGFSGPGESVFNVPIRTVVMEGEQGEMGIGSGIVFDSDPEEEWRECLLKADFLTRPRPAFQLIETLLWLPGSGYWLLDYHLDRLARSAAYFLYQHDEGRVAEALEKAVAGAGEPTRVRLLLHRDGRVETAAVTIPDYAGAQVMPHGFPGEPRRVIFSEHSTDQENIHLYHKTTLRRFYDDERRRQCDRGFYEVLFCNSRGEVTEGAVTNVFVAREGILLTPPVKCGLLPGTFRAWLLDQGRAVERVLSREEVLAAGEVYVGNSVRGLARVTVESA